MQAEYLTNRDEIIAKATALTSRVRKTWIGMGRTATWIDTESAFGRAIREAAARGVSIKLVVFLEDETPPYVQKWLDIGARVTVFDHGYIRVLVFDRTDAIIAFPVLVTNRSVNRDYYGWHIQGKPAVTNLWNYCEQAEAEGFSLPSDAVSGREGSQELRKAFIQIWPKLIGWLVARAPDYIRELKLP